MFPEILKRYRKSFGWTQKQLADRLNVSQPAVGSWESGRTEPSQDIQNKLANLFGISTDELLGRNNNNKVDLKLLIQQNAMTYGGKEISEHDLKVLEGVVNSILGGDANEDK